MQSLWSLREQYRLWRNVSVGAILTNHGSDFTDDQRTRLFNIPEVDIDEVAVEEESTRHDVVAFLNVMRRSMPDDLKPYLHLGMTSSDLVDSAQALRLQYANEILTERGIVLTKRLARFSIQYWNTDRLARTHGQAAEATTLGIQFARYTVMLNNAVFALGQVPGLTNTHFSGPVGLYRHWVPQRHLEFNRMIGIAKPLQPMLPGQAVPRTSLGVYVAALGALASVIESIALEIRLGAQFGVQELAEPQTDGQVGSSSISQKQNPITCEKMAGLARIVRAQVEPVLAGVATWQERDISHSSAERVALQTATSVTDHMLDSMNNLGWGRPAMVDRNRMRVNLAVAGDRTRTAHFLFEGQKAGIPVDVLRQEIRAAFNTPNISNIRTNLERRLEELGYPIRFTAPPPPRVGHLLTEMERLATSDWDQ